MSDYCETHGEIRLKMRPPCPDCDNHKLRGKLDLAHAEIDRYIGVVARLEYQLKKVIKSDGVHER